MSRKEIGQPPEEKKRLKTELNITRKSFKDQSGNIRFYTAYEFELGGKVFGLIAKSEDKKLLNYLLEELGAFDEK
jgi:hypothetical protein